MSAAIADITIEPASAVSIFAQNAPTMINLGFSPIPIKVGEKRPAIGTWQTRCNRVASADDIARDSRIPDAGIGVALGFRVGEFQIVAVDLDVEGADLERLVSALPTSTMTKRGAKGLTSYYRTSQEVATKRYRTEAGRGLADLQAHGTQTVIPPSRHPSGVEYVWMAGPTSADRLPILTAIDLANFEATCKALGWQEAAEATGVAEHAAAAADGAPQARGEANGFCRELNDIALGNLDAWVPFLTGLYGTRRKPGGYEGVPLFRPSGENNPPERRKRNLSITASGICDWGDGHKGYTPINLVMASEGVDLGAATLWLKERVMPVVDGHEFDAVTASNGASARQATNAVPAHDIVTGEIVSPLIGAAPRIIMPTPFVFRPISEIPQRKWVFGRKALREEITGTIAPGGLGKTALGLVEGAAMATGRDLTGTRVDEPLRVWVWNGEEPLHELERRLAGICLHYQLTEADFGGRLFIDNGNDMGLVLAEQSREGVTVHRPLIDAMINGLKSREIDVMIVDPFISTHNVNENDNNAIQQAVTAWKSVAVGADCAIMLSHHSRKLNGQVATAESSRGGDALVAKARSVRALNPMSSEQAKAFDVDERESKNIFWIDPSGGKANMTSRGSAREWYKIVNVPLFNSVRGNVDLGDEIGVVTPWQLPDRVSADLDSAKIEALKRRLLLQHWRAAAQSADRPDWVGVLIAEVFEIDTTIETWRDRAKAILSQLMQDEVKVVKARAPNRQAVNIVMPKHNADNDNEPQDDC